MTDVTSDVVSGPIGDKAVSAVWQLSLALVFKMIVTVFTFGIKVRQFFCDFIRQLICEVATRHRTKAKLLTIV